MTDCGEVVGDSCDIWMAPNLRRNFGDNDIHSTDDDEEALNGRAVDLSCSKRLSISSVSPLASSTRSADSSPERRPSSSDSLNQSFSDVAKPVSPSKSPEREKMISAGRPRGRPKKVTVSIVTDRQTRSASRSEPSKQRFDFRPRKAPDNCPPVINVPQLAEDVRHKKKSSDNCSHQVPEKCLSEEVDLTKKLAEPPTPPPQQQPVEKRSRKRAISPSFEQVTRSDYGQSKSVRDQFKEIEIRDSNIGLGIYIQCAACMKWRHLPPGSDPAQQPTPWYCSMNNDERYNRCLIEQQDSASDLIIAEFGLGSIVWAKTPGFPWWPAMVDLDPNTREFYWIEESTKKLTHYNVTYFDDKVSRAWVTTSNIRRFTGDISGRDWVLVGKHQNYAKQRDLAVHQANDAILLSIEERVEKFGFVSQLCRDNNASAAHVLNKLGSVVLSPPPSRADSGVCSSASPTLPSTSSSLSNGFESSSSRKRKRLQSSERTGKRRNRHAKNVEEEEIISPLPPKPMSLSDWLEIGPRSSFNVLEKS